jgi:hypothetical protein
VTDRPIASQSRCHPCPLLHCSRRAPTPPGSIKRTKEGRIIPARDVAVFRTFLISISRPLCPNAKQVLIRVDTRPH